MTDNNTQNKIGFKFRSRSNQAEIINFVFEIVFEQSVAVRGCERIII